MGRITSQPIQVLTETAAAEVNQYELVSAGGNPSVGSVPDGVALEDAAIGEEFPLGTDGVFPVLCSEALTVGDWLVVTANGHCGAAATSGHKMFGRAVSATSAAEEVVMVKFQFMGEV